MGAQTDLGKSFQSLDMKSVKIREVDYRNRPGVESVLSGINPFHSVERLSPRIEPNKLQSALY